MKDMRYGKQPDAEYWPSWRINRKFMLHLQREYPHTFTNAMAYRVYLKYCWTGRASAIARIDKASRELFDEHPETAAVIISQAQQDFREGDYFMQMNVRNHLCAAAYRGILTRLGKGEYQWPIEEWLE